MKQPPYPLTERLKHRLEPHDLKELQAVESAAYGKFVHAASNGVAGRLWGIAKEVGLVFAFVWFISQKWNTVEKQVADSAADIAAVQSSLSTVLVDVQSIKLEQTRVRTQLDFEADRDAGTKRTPVFGPPYGTVR